MEVYALWATHKKAIGVDTYALKARVIYKRNRLQAHVIKVE